MSSNHLERIRVQTARMLEIYSLIRGELEKGSESLLPARKRQELNRAIDTIAVNMKQLQTYFTADMEESSPDAVGCQSVGAGHQRQPAGRSCRSGGRDSIERPRAGGRQWVK